MKTKNTSIDKDKAVDKDKALEQVMAEIEKTIW